MNNPEQVAKYACFKCREPLQEDSMQEHPCFQVLQSDIEDAQLQFLDVACENGENIKVEYLEGEDELGEVPLEYIEETTEDLVEETQTKNRVKLTSNGRRGDWTSADIHRLLEIYIKNCRALPLQKGLHNHYLWDRVMRDLKPYGNFSRFLVQAKIKKLKKAGRALLDSGNDTKWPYMSKIIELFRVEGERAKRALDVLPNQSSSVEDCDDMDSEANNTAPEEETESDVVGLRRWTVKETRHLIEVYKKHLHKFFEGPEPRKIAWDDIVADLDYDLSQKYSMYQIRAKIRNAQNTYRNIVEKKRKKPKTHWPLLADLASLAKTEREMAAQHNVSIAIYRWGGKEDPDSAVDNLQNSSMEGSVSHSRHEERGPTRWNDEETRELLSCFKNYLMDLHSAKLSDSKEIWAKIASEVNSIRRRKINSLAARMKIDSLRQIWEKSEMGYEMKEYMPFYDELKEVFEMEEAIQMADREDMVEDESLSNEAELMPPPKKHRFSDAEERISKGKKASNEEFPSWFQQYRRDAEKKHQDRMAVQEKLLKTIQRFLRSR